MPLMALEPLETLEARFHCVMYDDSIWQRAWTSRELVVSKEAGGHTDLLQSTETGSRTEDAGAAAALDPACDYHREMHCSDPDDTAMIQQEALRAFRSPARFNDFITRLRRGPPPAPAWDRPVDAPGPGSR